MRIILCGGRTYHLTLQDRAWLDAFHAAHGLTEVIHGAARGADTDGGLWAQARGIPVQPMPANWDRHGIAAGRIRNAAMLKHLLWHAGPIGSVGVLAFSGGAGTADMCRKARAKGVPVWRVADGLAVAPDLLQQVLL
jgi:hypothetical protein